MNSKNLHINQAFADDPKTNLVKVRREIKTPMSSYKRFESVGEFLESTEIDEGVYSIWYEGLPIDFELTPSQGAPLVVTFHGAILTKAQLPWFIGAGVTSQVKASVLKFSDSSMYLDDSLRLAWYAGNQFQDQLQTVLHRIVGHIKQLLQPSRIVFFGGSGGGFAALEMAIEFKDSVAVVFNPQTNIDQYDPNAVADYKRICWEGDPGEDVSIDLVSKYSEGIQECTVVYLQNRNDVPHIKRHMAPFLRALEAPEKHLLLLEGWENGHTPPPKDVLQKTLTLVAEQVPFFEFEKLGFKTVGDELRNANTWLGVKPNSLSAFLVESGVAKLVVDESRLQSPNLSVYRRFFDHPATRSWKVDQAGDGSYEVMMPSKTSINFNINDLRDLDFWNQDFDSQGATNRLWLRSCWYAAEIARRGDTDTAVEILMSYRQRLQEHDLDPRKMGMNSFDHCLAINLRTCSWLIATVDLTPGQRESITLLVEDLLKVIFRYDFFLGNNHGVMLALAVIHAAVISGLSLPGSHDYSALATFLFAVFDRAVTRNGLVRENTTAYQYMWINWAWEIANTFEYVLGDRENARSFADLARRISSAGGYLAVDSRTSLPLGDGCKQSAPVVPTRTGILDAADDGLFVQNKGNGHVFAYTAGSKSAVHRHADDHALRLFFRGVELIADAGFNSYDVQDPVSRCVTSQRGHSGLYFPQFDDRHGQKFYPWDEPRKYSQGSLHVLEKSSSISRLLSHRVVDDCFYTQREISFSAYAQKISIRDFARAPSEYVEAAPVSRFLIPATFEKSVPTGLSFMGNGVTIDISARKSKRVNVYKGTAEFEKASDLNGISGIICVRPGQPEAAWVVEVELDETAQGSWQSSVEISYRASEPI